MDIDKLLQKLEPLISERVERWHRARDFADPEVKGLLEKEILSVAYKLLGDFRRKVLLSLPPQKVGLLSRNSRLLYSTTSP